MLRLAGHLKMTVSELCVRMDSREFSEWKAFAKYYEPFGDEWRQTALTIVACLAPYVKRDKFPKPEDFMPMAPTPQSAEEVAAEIDLMMSMMPEDPEKPKWRPSAGESATP